MCTMCLASAFPPVDLHDSWLYVNGYKCVLASVAARAALSLVYGAQSADEGVVSMSRSGDYNGDTSATIAAVCKVKYALFFPPLCAD